MKHKLLSTAAVLLLVMLTWSCTTDNDPMPTPVTSAPRELSIVIGPRPAYTAGATLSATRAVQTPDAAEWETGDVLWLYVHFSWITDEAIEKTENYVSALRYNADGWHPLSEQESIDLNTSGIKPDGSGAVYYSGFNRQPRWSAEALASGTTNAKVRLEAYYLGKGIPDEDGILVPDYTTDVMEGAGNFSPGVPVTISLQHRYSRLHVTNEAKCVLKYIKCVSGWNLGNGVSMEADEIGAIVPSGGGYYFARIDKNSKVTLDDNIYTLTPGSSDENGNGIYSGFTYTLVPLKNGTVTPGDLQTNK
ncbi:hypothetical protein NXY11_04265 [Parabacteroides faecis]|uniref:hypothetical protein n=1 Tax=Parabacteroides faecis TaxID=1217282 RepID=UPI00216444CC|nr:hypothetical protein [Parabacteroides faecis]MCS2893942.1 hypothetical protein [Parabacteroides faecis]UVQ47467.1 hypothetical protein NXY11_04265 [Parabacteroides faecis]